VTPPGERARRGARAVEDATVRAIEEGTDRIRQTMGAGARAGRKAAGRVRRTVGRQTLLDMIRLLPRFVRLLAGLLADRRVSIVDKILVGFAIAYVASPADLLPDWIPFLGQIDDVYLVTTTLQRLIANAGRRVVRRYWDGPMRLLEDATLARVVSSAAVLLPRTIRRQLRRTR
jgi:uncharacterized membrane protein YkvA (DUF1232 family)